VATTLGGFSRNFWQLIGARTVLGIGEAGYGPASISLLGDFFTQAHRGRVLSYWCDGYFAHPFVKWMILPVHAALSRARALECKGVFLRHAEAYAVPLLLLQK
jgi:sugar phosphate permease